MKQRQHPTENPDLEASAVHRQVSCWFCRDARQLRTVHGDEENHRDTQVQFLNEVVDKPVLVSSQGAESKTTTHSAPATLFNATPCPSAAGPLHSKWHELAQEHRPSNVLRDTSMSPNRERDQGACTLALRARQRSVYEEVTGRVINRHGHCIETARLRRRSTGFVEQSKFAFCSVQLEPAEWLKDVRSNEERTRSMSEINKLIEEKVIKKTSETICLNAGSTRAFE